MATFLVVDDHASIRRLITLALEDRGHDCDEAEDGVEALALITANEYKVVVLDLMMPEMDGISLLERLPRDGEFTTPPALILTATSAPNARPDALAAGAAKVMGKPFDPDLVADEVEKLMGAGP